MKTCILMASPRKEGNTAALAGVLCSELDRLDEKFTYHYLYDMDIAGCIACRRCQGDRSGFNCFRQDDMQQIAEDILASDVILFATPIYSWYCTPPLKAVMDRLVYGMNKYYGETKGPSIWAGKILAAVTTCGYPPEKGSDIFEKGLRRYCRHSGLEFAGMLTEHHEGYGTVFMDSQKAEHIKEFVRILYGGGQTSEEAAL